MPDNNKYGSFYDYLQTQTTPEQIPDGTPDVGGINTPDNKLAESIKGLIQTHPDDMTEAEVYAAEVEKARGKARRAIEDVNKKFQIETTKTILQGRQELAKRETKELNRNTWFAQELAKAAEKALPEKIKLDESLRTDFINKYVEHYLPKVRSQYEQYRLKKANIPDEDFNKLTGLDEYGDNRAFLNQILRQDEEQALSASTRRKWGLGAIGAMYDAATSGGDRDKFFENVKESTKDSPYRKAFRSSIVDENGNPTKEVKRLLYEMYDGDKTKYKEGMRMLLNYEFEDWKNAPIQEDINKQEFQKKLSTHAAPLYYAYRWMQGLRGATADAASYITGAVSKATGSDKSLSSIVSEKRSKFGETIPAPVDDLGVVNGLLSEVSESIGHITGLFKTFGVKPGTIRGSIKSAAYPYITKLAKNITVSKVAGVMDNILGTARVFAPSTYTNYYQNLINKGYSEKEAENRAAAETAGNIVLMSFLQPLLSGKPKNEQIKIIDDIISPKDVTIKNHLKDYVKHSFEAGGVMAGLHIYDAINAHSQDTELGLTNEPFDWSKAVKESVHPFASGFLFGSAMTAINGQARPIGSPQAKAIAAAIHNKDRFLSEVNASVNEGRLDPKDASRLIKFINRIEPTYKRALEESETGVSILGVKTPIKRKLIPEEAIQYSIEAERLRETATQLERAKNSNAPEETIARLEEKILKDKERLTKLVNGTFTKGRVIGGEEMAKIADTYTRETSKMPEKTKERIKKEAPYESSEESLDRFKEDPEIRELMAVMGNSERASEFKEREEILKGEIESIEQKYRPYKDETTGLELVPKREMSEEDATRLKELKNDLKDLRENYGLIGKHSDAIGFTRMEGSPAVVLDKEGNIIDGKKRVARAILDGEKTIEVVKPIGEKKNNEIIEEEFKLSPDFEGLTDTNKSLLEEAAYEYEKVFTETESHVDGLKSAIGLLSEKGLGLNTIKKIINRLGIAPEPSMSSLIRQVVYNRVDPETMAVVDKYLTPEERSEYLKLARKPDVSSEVSRREYEALAKERQEAEKSETQKDSEKAEPKESPKSEELVRDEAPPKEERVEVVRSEEPLKEVESEDKAGEFENVEFSKSMGKEPVKESSTAQETSDPNTIERFFEGQSKEVDKTYPEDGVYGDHYTNGVKFDSGGRIAPEPLEVPANQKPQKLWSILQKLNNKSRQLIYGKPRNKKAAGVYTPSTGGMTIRFKGDLDTTAHELGHKIDDKFSVLKDVDPKNKALRKELDVLMYNSAASSPPAGYPNPLRYRMAEGFAEFLRALIVNPDGAKKVFPNLYKLYESKVDAETKKIVQEFSDDVRTFYGSSAIDKTLANIRTEKDKEGNIFARRLKEFFETDEIAGLRISFFDRLAQNLTQPFQVFKLADKYLRDVTGKSTPLPSEDPYLLARLFLGIDGKTGEILNSGMINEKGEVLRDSKGNAMTLKWLLEPFNYITEEVAQREKEETIAYMVSQRTLEKADQLKKSDRITGAGAGMVSDIQVAREAIELFEKYPKDKQDRIKEAARRYREYADAILKYAVAKGRMSKESYKDIKENNEYYVAFQRIMESEPGVEIEVPKYNKRGILGSADPIKKLKGGTAAIEDPYVALFESMHRIVKESDRNEILVSFRDALVNARSMYGDNFKELSEFGQIVGKGTEGAVKIYIEGKPEYWVFNKEIKDSIDNLSDAKYNWLIRTIGMPGRLMRWAVTHWPTFALRNATRDTQDRMIKSNSNSLLDNWYGIKDFTLKDEYWEGLARSGGLNAGYYTRDFNHYYGLQSQAMKSLAKENGVKIINPISFKKMWRGYEKFLQSAENVNRVAEYKAAFRKAKREGMDDYNARLYAAYHARDLIDFALMGKWMQQINQIIPFSNAHIQGLRSSWARASENPLGFSLRVLNISIVPAVLEWIYNHSDKETAREYEDLPDYQRDLFYNIKTNSGWITIPKPFEVGMFGSAASRYLSSISGNDKAFDGFGGMVYKSLSPFDEASLVTMQPMVELLTNRDLFRGKFIVPPDEIDAVKELQKREGASRLSKMLSPVLMDSDPRKIDHFIRAQFSYFGNAALKLSDIGREDGRNQFGLSDTGFYKDDAVYGSKSVQKYMEIARKYKLTGTKGYREFRKLMNDYFEEKDKTEKERKGKALKEYARIESETLDRLGQQKVLKSK